MLRPGNIKMKNIISIMLAIALIGCGIKKSLISYVDNPALISQINSSADKNYPENFKTLHHAMLEIKGKDYVLNGYIKINRTLNQFSIIAQNDLGGTIFEINSSKSKEPQIIVPVKAFKESWLKKSVIKDLAFLYLSRPFESPKLVVLENGLFKLAQENRDGIDEERTFKKGLKENEYLLQSYARLKSKKIIYSIDFKYNNDSMEKFADTIFIANKKMHYKLKINALYFVKKNDSKGKQ